MRPTPTALPVLALMLALPGAALAADDRAQPRAAPAQELRPRLDVAFVLDTTGSMGDELDVVKEQLVSIARRLASGQPAPDVRFAVVPFRDRGDEYVARTFPFERELKKVQRVIEGLSAAGGGDKREAVSAGLHAALKLDWDASPAVARVAFLVGDAGPQAYADEPGWEHAVTMLREKKIAVHAIGCSGLEPAERAQFRSIAERTRGEFEELTYSRVVASADGRRRTVLSSGGETFVAEGELSADEWKKGADTLVAEGKVKKADAGAFGDASAGPGDARASRALASFAAPAAEPSPVRNNLDSELAGRLMKAAEEAGARYAK